MKVDKMKDMETKPMRMACPLINLPRELAWRNGSQFKRPSPRLIGCKVDKSRNGATKIAKPNLHCDSDAALETAADVVAVPCTD